MIRQLRYLFADCFSEKASFEHRIEDLGWINIGEGDEATCHRCPFPSENLPPIVARINHGLANPKLALTILERHKICYELDLYFRRNRKYAHPHIPRPIVSFGAGYFYEYAPGEEGFMWETMDDDFQYRPVLLKEWNETLSCFCSAGISLGSDICESFDGRVGKNVVVSGGIDDKGNLPATWYRIDFGFRSLPIDKDRLAEFLKNNNL